MATKQNLSNYRLWDSQTNKITISRDVTFNEDNKREEATQSSNGTGIYLAHEEVDEDKEIGNETELQQGNSIYETMHNEQEQEMMKV